MANPKSSGEVVMKKRLNVVNNTKNRSVNATAENTELVNRFTTKISPERNTPALREKTHLRATWPTSRNGTWTTNNPTIT